MPTVIFVLFSAPVMYVFGYVDYGLLESPEAPIPKSVIVLVAILAGVLSGRIVHFSNNGPLYAGIHTVFFFIPFVVGLGNLGPYYFTFGVLAVFLIGLSIVNLYYQPVGETSSQE